MSFASDSQCHEFVGMLERLLRERGGRLVRWADSGGGQLTLVGGHPDGPTISMPVTLIDGFWATNENNVPINPMDVARILLRAGRRGSPVQSMRLAREEQLARERAAGGDPPMSARDRQSLEERRAQMRSVEEVYAASAAAKARRAKKVTIGG